MACPKSHRRNFTDVLDFMLTLPILAEQKRPTSWCSHGDSAPSAPPSAVAYDVIMCPAAQCRAATEPISLPAAATCRLALGASDDGGGDIGALDERGLTTGGACLSQGAACGNCQYGTLRARFTALHPKAQYFACTFPHNDASHAQLCKLPGAISVGDVGDFRVACALITRPACSPAVVDFQQLENELTSLNRGDLPGFRLLAVLYARVHSVDCASTETVTCWGRFSTRQTATLPTRLRLAVHGHSDAIINTLRLVHSTFSSAGKLTTKRRREGASNDRQPCLQRRRR